MLIIGISGSPFASEEGKRETGACIMHQLNIFEHALGINNAAPHRHSEECEYGTYIMHTRCAMSYAECTSPV